MALDDVLRDTNNLHLREYFTNDEALRREMESLQDASDEELWRLHTSLGVLPLRGKAVLALLRMRFPDQIR